MLALSGLVYKILQEVDLPVFLGFVSAFLPLSAAWAVHVGAYIISVLDYLATGTQDFLRRYLMAYVVGLGANIYIPLEF